MSTPLKRWSVLAAAALVFMILSLPRAAKAKPQRQDTFSIYPRIGLVFPSQDPAAGFKSRAGFQLGAIGLYCVKPWLSFGGMVEWERTGISTVWLSYPNYTSIGHFHTFSLLPVVEFRYYDDDLSVSPYLITGVGANLNFLERSAAISALGASASFSPTAAFRVAGGVDFYASKNLGFRMELGWKFNKGTVNVKSSNPLVPTGKSGFDASTVTASVGILLGV